MFMGSPPRRRGKVRIEVGNNFLPRITSAQAGKSTIEVTYEDRDEDHPRAGGEKIGRYHTDGFVHGITPAQAGKSLSGLKKGPAFKDHPRAGGEKQPGLDAYQRIQGSPPRRRGKAGA